MKKLTYFQIGFIILLMFTPIVSHAGPPETWSFYDIPTRVFSGVAYGNGKYVAVGNSFMSSTNGVNWTISSQTPSNGLNGIAYGMNRFVAVGDSETIYTSTDGDTWTQRSLGASGGQSFNLKGVAYGDGTFIVVGGTFPQVKIYVSSDGINWSSPYNSDNLGTFAGISYGGGRFVAIANGRLTGPTYDKLVSFSSTDYGTTWSIRESTGSVPTIYGLTYGNGQFVAINQTQSFSSTDGNSWSARNTGYNISGPRAGISFGNGYFVAVGGSTILYSPDLLTWISPTVSNSLNAITYGSDTMTMFVAVGATEYAASNLIGNQLVVHSIGDPGSGTVRSTPDGFDCSSGGSCIEIYDNNTVVTLKAVPRQLTNPPYTQYYFNGWSGGGCDGNVSLTCKVTMDADKTVTANFTTTRPVSGTWAETYGGTTINGINFIQQTSDGGFIAAGQTTFGAGSSDFLVMKLDADGNIAWSKTYGGTGSDNAESIQQTAEGGYIVAGYTYSYGAGNGDLWVLKLKTDGTVDWQKTYGGSGYDGPDLIQQTSDGGYILASASTSYGAGYQDIWVLKLKPNGTIDWQKTYGSTGGDNVSSIQQTSDGGYIISGPTNSPFGTGCDIWMLKLNGDGTIEWQKTYGPKSCSNDAYTVQTLDNGYILAGSTFLLGNDDIWVMKLKSDGTVDWQKTYGGTNSDYVSSILETPDGGFALAGETYSFGAGNNDVWILKLKSDGTVDWQRTYGGSGYDYVYSLQQTSDNGFIVAGETAPGGGGAWGWVWKLDSYGIISGCSGLTITNTNITGRVSPFRTRAQPG